MTVQSRGARSRRGGRGPGWPLLTGLLVLAILASSTLVFTNRVELLRLAVVLSLWAAVMAAFVTVVYRRQSELDQARARDMKFVYDLQLDREISARREYELSVEAHLRRQMARELRAQAADEMAALRSELSSLRSQLEVMLGTDLGERPALENDRVAVPMPAAPGRIESSRVTVVTEDVIRIAAAETLVDSPIIDVPEEPLAPQEPPAPAEERHAPRDDADGLGRPVEDPPVPQRPAPPHPEVPWRPPEVRRGRHSGGDAARAPHRPAPVAPQVPRGRHWVGPGEPPAPPGPALGRHRGQQDQPVPEPPEESTGQHTGGQSVADLMARLQVSGPGGGGGRRRRED